MLLPNRVVHWLCQEKVVVKNFTAHQYRQPRSYCPSVRVWTTSLGLDGVETPSFGLHRLNGAQGAHRLDLSYRRRPVVRRTSESAWKPFSARRSADRVEPQRLIGATGRNGEHCSCHVIQRKQKPQDDPGLTPFCSN